MFPLHRASSYPAHLRYPCPRAKGWGLPQEHPSRAPGRSGPATNQCPSPPILYESLGEAREWVEGCEDQETAEMLREMLLTLDPFLIVLLWGL